MKWVLSLSLLIVLLVGVGIGASAEARQFTLEKDTWFLSGPGSALYQKGTVITLNQDGHVVWGTLANAAPFKTVGRLLDITFAAGTRISFLYLPNQAGVVEIGVPKDDTTLYNGGSSLLFMGGKQVKFRQNNGNVHWGTLKYDTKLKDHMNRERLYRAGQRLTFLPDGRVESWMEGQG